MDGANISVNAENVIYGFTTQGPIRSVARDVTYNTNNKNMGIALIFNHKDIKGQDPRNGTERDRDRMEAILKKFGFDVRTFNDLSYKELCAQLKDVSKEDHSENDCLLIVVMSHGNQGRICAKDWSYPVEHLWTPFLGANCKSLINKPKLFFIQACRGNQLEKAVTYTVQATTMGRSKANEKHTITYAIPSSSDFLIFYSTFQGHSSFRDVPDGSWFIQCVCKTLEEAEKRDDKEGTELFQLLTTVNRKVAYEYQTAFEDEYSDVKEMPNFLSTLTKLFYLKAKRN